MLLNLIAIIYLMLVVIGFIWIRNRAGKEIMLFFILALIVAATLFVLGCSDGRIVFFGTTPLCIR